MTQPDQPDPYANLYDLERSIEITRAAMRGTSPYALSLVRVAESVAKAVREIGRAEGLDLETVARGMMVAASCVGSVGEQMGQVNGPTAKAAFTTSANVQGAAAVLILDDLARYASDPR